MVTHMDHWDLVGPLKARISDTGVALFNRQWPGSPLSSERAYWFEFDAEGNLIDTDVPEHSDGPASAALSEDAKSWLDDEGYFDDASPDDSPSP